MSKAGLPILVPTLHKEVNIVIVLIVNITNLQLAESMQLDPRPEYHRAFLSWNPGADVPLAYSTGNQLSSRLLSMASAQALLKLPPATPENKSMDEGSTVEAILLGM